jgi:S1-C subfamily serine protease
MHIGIRTMRASSRTLFVFLCIVIATKVSAQGIDRVWTAATVGFKDRAVLKAIGKEFVTLKPNGEEPKTVLLKDLSDEDQKFIAAVRQCEESAKVFLRVAEHRSRFAASPEAVADILIQLHETNPGDFAASFFAGTLDAFTGSPGRLGKAKKHMNETITHIKKVRASLPTIHTKTLVAALNNRGVVALREGSHSQAIKYFLEAAELSEALPFAVYHNATLLIEYSGKAGNKAKVSKSDHVRMTRAIAKATPEHASARIPKRFVYSLDHEEFTSLVEAPKQPTPPPHTPAPAGIDPGLQKLVNGSGFLISETIVVTNRHIVDSLPQGSRVVLKNESSFPDGVVVNVIAVSDDPEVDLALLELTNPPRRVKPIPLRIRLPREGEEIAVLGYPMTQVFGETLNTSRGIVSSLSKDGKQVYHDATANPGNSGGPCIDHCGNVIGVLYATGIGRATGRNFAVSSETTRAFVSKNSKAFAFASERDEELKIEDRIALAKEAVVRVEVYGQPRPIPLPPEGVVANDTLNQLLTVMRLGLLPEYTCLACKGKGTFPCGCVDGRISERRVIPNAFETQVIQVPCPKCSGLGGFDCSSCDNGVLPLFD